MAYSDRQTDERGGQILERKQRKKMEFLER